MPALNSVEMIEDGRKREANREKEVAGVRKRGEECARWATSVTLAIDVTDSRQACEDFGF